MAKIDIEAKAIEIVRLEKSQWEDATAFVTDRVAFRMRELVKIFRKNYWGIFDKPKDEQTGRDKTWIPLTESTVDSVLKNIDLDAKDINLRAKKPSAVGLTAIVRSFVMNFLDSIFFGEILDEFERNLCIDGTAVWKTYEEYDKHGKKKLCVVPVDLLNFYIDPTAHSIQETNAVIERALMTPDEVRGMSGWINTEDVQGIYGLSMNEPDLRGTQYGGRVKMVEIFERWGLMPKSLITGRETDKESYVEGHIVISNVDNGARLHLIEENKKKLKPYEEAWYTRIHGRWYGRGIAEKVMMLQLWMNTIVNIRITRSYVSQLGIFKIRKGSGITPQMLSRLAVNGALSVNNPDDITQMVLQDASQASYTDENVVNDWAAKVTSSFEAITGEPLPASTPATSAVIQTRQANSQFVFVKKGVGLFLQRWMERHVLPFIEKQMTAETVVRVTGEIDELRQLDEHMANELLYKKLSQMNENGEFFDVQRVEEERQRILDRLSRSGEDRFVELADKVDLSEYDVQVYITNEEVDKAVLVQNLVSVLQTIPNIPGLNIDPTTVMRQIFDLMGLDSGQFKSRQMQTAGAPQGQPSQPLPAATEQSIVTMANTMTPSSAPSI